MLKKPLAEFPKNWAGNKEILRGLDYIAQAQRDLKALDRVDACDSLKLAVKALNAAQVEIYKTFGLPAEDAAKEAEDRQMLGRRAKVSERRPPWA